MAYSEVIRTIDFIPISVSDESSEDYIFRVEILRQESSQANFQMRVSRRETFEFKTTIADTECKWQSRKVNFEDVTLDWRLIKADSAENVLSKLLEEIDYAFPFLSEKGIGMLKYDEVVKVIDLEPISIEETNSYYRFRIEIIKKDGSQRSFGVRAYRFERFELQPSYPIVDGKPKYERAAPVILIEDESSIFKQIENETIDEVIQQVLQIANKLKKGSISI